MIEHLLESSHRDDSNKWSNIGFVEEITKVELIGVNFTHLILSSGCDWRKRLRPRFQLSLLPSVIHIMEL